MSPNSSLKESRWQSDSSCSDSFPAFLLSISRMEWSILLMALSFSIGFILIVTFVPFREKSLSIQPFGTVSGYLLMTRFVICFSSCLAENGVNFTSLGQAIFAIGILGSASFPYPRTRK